MSFFKFLFLLSYLFLACQHTTSESDKVMTTPSVVQVKLDQNPPKRIQRKEIQQKLQQKIKQKEDLYVHLLVPLCDNDYQGIVKVNSKLGDGFNPKSNLYWGAMYGIKTYFKRAKDWQLVSAKPQSEVILERVIFKKKLPSGGTVYLIADAYRGDQMKACVVDFLNALAGIKKEVLPESKLGLYGNADLLLFNGHNGLMDVSLDYVINKDKLRREAGVIGCISYDYFAPFFEHTHSYPLLTTNGLMAPEAYVLKNALDQWSLGKSAKEIHQAAAAGYHQYQKCGTKAAYRLFHHGWKE